MKNIVYTIPAEFEKLLDNIETAEGGYLHRNPKEKDVTTAFGIYRGMYPGTGAAKEIWNYIVEVAKDVVGAKPSNKWTKEEIRKIDALLDPDIERYYTYLFYSKFFKGAHLELFPTDIVILMANVYTNSPKGAWMSIQEALISVYKDGILNIESEKELSGVDGGFGGKTKKCLLSFKDTADWKDVIIFRKSIIIAMKSFYIDLAVGNPDKYLSYLDGWDNRLILQEKELY